MAGPNKGFSRAAWLIAAQGGWWKPMELVELMPAGTEVACISSALWWMANRQHTLQARGRRGAMEYAVTPACFVPMGMTVGDVLRAVGGDSRVLEGLPCRS